MSPSDTLDRQLHVGQQRPGVFVVRLDRRRFFRQRELDANQPVHVAVGDVVNDLPHRPAFGPIRCVELLVGEIGDGGPHAVWQAGNGIDRRSA